ncbi:MAG: hypothetical protein EOP33_00545 [Rickettsiaceae bacterium]|nr:MAG: hypothetical protein EOP33_00545 [Rickettsiaceae bacterium]
MITLLASIAGFISSLIPEILKFSKDKNDKDHEIKILDRQIEFNKRSRKTTLEDIAVSGDIIEQQALYSTYKSGIYWVDALNGSVRPVLAYSFFLAYLTIKLIQFKAITAYSSLIEYINVIWSIDDQAIFASIISFYFGQRTFSKFSKYR